MTLLGATVKIVLRLKHIQCQCIHVKAPKFFAEVFQVICEIGCLSLTFFSHFWKCYTVTKISETELQSLDLQRVLFPFNIPYLCISLLPYLEKE